MPLKIAREFAPGLLEARSSEYLFCCLSEASGRLGFDHFALSYEPRARSAPVGNVLLHNYPADWADLYVSFDLAGHDPVRRACDRRMRGFEWREVADMIPMSLADQRMLAAGRRIGLVDGFTVPRHLPGAASGSCSFVVGANAALPRDALVVAEFLGGLALEAVGGLVCPTLPPARPVLSERQRECVLWAARGKTAAETAVILGVRIGTVIKHLRDARARYNVHSGQLLLLCALYDGLLGFPDVFHWWNNPHV